MSSLVYVYAVLASPIAADVKGINERPVRWVEENQLTAAISEVPGEEFEDEPLNEHVRDMSWLGPRAIAHQDVNNRLSQDAEAIVPLAFGTVFHDEDRVRQLLRDEGPALSARLNAVRGCAEWVVALHVLKQPELEELSRASAAIQALRSEIDASSEQPGRAHLLRRRLETLQRDEGRRLQADVASEVLARLREVCQSVYEESLPADAVERPLLRASVLVRRTDESHFLDEIERLRAKWSEPTYGLLLTGPWPPYRFGGLET